MADKRTAPPSFTPGTLDDTRMKAALKSLELTVKNKLDGVLHGDHLGLIPGPGSDPGESRTYQPGDDVRRMDWSVTARTTHPHVRQMVADRELETWLIVDMSGSVDFGSGQTTKRDLTVAACGAVTYLVSGGGNRVGAVIANGETLVRVPASGSRQASQRLLSTVASAPHAPDGARGELRIALDALRRPERRRGLAVIVSDFLGPINWQRELRALAGRHEVLGIEVLDPRDLDLPVVGEVRLRDAESGELREVNITEQLRDDFSRAAHQHHESVVRAFRGVGAPLMELRTDRDWLTDVARFVARRRRGLAGAT